MNTGMINSKNIHENAPGHQGQVMEKITDYDRLLDELSTKFDGLETRIESIVKPEGANPIPPADPLAPLVPLANRIQSLNLRLVKIISRLDYILTNLEL